MNTALANLSDDEINKKFIEAVAKAKGGDYKEFATLMADFNALQRPDDDPLKTALLKNGGMLLGGQVEALGNHEDTRQAMELSLEWGYTVANPKFTKAQLLTSLQLVGWHMLVSQEFKAFKELMNFIQEMQKAGMKNLFHDMEAEQFQNVARQVLPAKIADKAAENREAKRSKIRAPRKKKSE